jgi:choline-sulfatase
VRRTMGHTSGWQRLGALVASLFVALAGGAAPARETGPSPSVILISVDTLRADHLSCYGYRRFLTPHIDSLRRNATIFTQIDSQIPLTLPSHTSLLTSTYPFANGVEENEDKLGPGLPTLATVLQSRGYHTAAFIGGYFLARRFGLNRGFDVYDAPFGRLAKPHANGLDLKRPAANVTRDAMDWLKQNSDRPFFVFIHFFDLHQPYAPLATLKKAYGTDEYDAELGYIDSVLGQFWTFLASHELFSKSLIVFTADHGESLGEHGESTHGYFVYQSTLHVPLIIKWPQRGGVHYPRLSDIPAGLIDVAPTVLQFLGIPDPASFQGQSLLGLLVSRTSSPARGVYSESLYAHDRLGFAPLRSLRVGERQYIDAPKPELYDLRRDPEELHNLAPREQALTQSMEAQLLALRSEYSCGKPAAKAPVSPSVLANLRSLGYLATSAPSQSLNETGPDPKDRLSEYRQYVRGIKLLATGRLPKAEAVFKEILNQDRANLAGHYDLAVCYADTGKFDEAIGQLRRALAIDPRDVQAAELMGGVWVDEGRYARARGEFRYLLSFASRDYAADYGLAVVAARQQRLDDAVRRLKSALQIRPQSATAHFALGQIYLERGQFSPAEAEFAEVTRLRPHFAKAYYELGLALQRQGRRREAEQAFQHALKCDAGFIAARKAIESVASIPR